MVHFAEAVGFSALFLTVPSPRRFGGGFILEAL